MTLAEIKAAAERLTDAEKRELLRVVREARRGYWTRGELLCILTWMLGES